MAEPLATDHGYDVISCAKTGRHKHEYTPKPGSAQRCPKGHRKFTVKIGGSLPVSVNCAVCAEQNRTATSFERGRADALAG